MPVARRCLLASLLALAACGGGAAPVFTPLDFDYLTKIKLDVGTLDIDDTWAPRGGDRHVEYLAPTRPLKALRLMADQRLVTGGTAGRAAFGIDDASIILANGSFFGSLAVHLDLFDADGKSLGSVQAQVHATQPAKDEEDEAATRADLDILTRKMMDNMNVEFEYQVRQALKGALQTTSPDAPAPPPVEPQDQCDTPPPP